MLENSSNIVNHSILKFDDKHAILLKANMMDLVNLTIKYVSAN